MARQHLFLCAAVSLAFLLPVIAARPGGRSCYTSFFFPDLNDNNLRTVTLIREGDGQGDGVFAGFKLFSIAATKLGGAGGSGWIDPSANLIQVRLHNLHRQKLFNPSLPHSLELPHMWRDGIMPDRPVVSHPAHSKIVRTWSFSTSNPHRPITWIDVHSRRGLWRHDLRDEVELKPLHLDDDAWRSSIDDLWRIVFGLLLGAACGMVVGFTTSMTWYLLRRLWKRFHEEDDVGFLYGYEELPSPKSSEKGNAKGMQKEVTKDTAGQVENM